MVVNLFGKQKMKIPVTYTLQKDWDELDKFKPYVIKELHRLFISQDRNEIKISRTKENRLDKLSRLELLEILRKLAKEEKCPLYLEEKNFPKRQLKNPEQKDSAFLADSDFITVNPKENEPIYLKLFSEFSNWYAADALKRKTNLADIGLLNLEKIYNLVLDIDEKFRIKPEQIITIDIDSLNYDRFTILRDKIIGNTKIRLDFRKDALDFLKDKNLVYHYEVNRPIEKIEIALNVEEFPKFRDEIAKAYEEEIKRQAPFPLITKTDPEAQQEAVKKPTDEAIYQIKYTLAREIILNNFLLSKVNFNSENDNIFGYIYKNPNKKINIEELKKPAGGKLTKDLHKIVENLGFKGELKKAFFNISKNDIFFRNPLTQKDLDDLGISRLKLPK